MKDQNIRNVLPAGIKFYPDLPRKDKEELIGCKFVLQDGKVIDDWDGVFGTTKFALLKLKLEDGQQFTTLCGGKAVVHQIEKLLKFKKLPSVDGIWCFLNKIANNQGEYYLLDWPEEPAEKEKEVEPVTASG